MLFRYVAIDGKTGQIKKGKLNAPAQNHAVQLLKEQGLYVSELKEINKSIWTKDLNIVLGKPVKSQEFVVFCNQLATLLRTGTSIVDSIRLLADQVSIKIFQKALHDIYQELRAGTPFSEACTQYPKIFDKIFVNMVRAGEASGQLDIIMERLASFYEKEHKIKGKVKSALMYPIAVSIVAIIVVIILLTQVLPTLVDNLLQVGGELPLPTKIVMTASDFLIGRWYLFLLVIMLIILFFIWAHKHPRGKYSLDYFKLKIPIFGTLILKSSLARLTRTLASLFSSSVPALQSLAMSSEIVNNEVIAKVLTESRESLRRGESLVEPLQQSWVFPSLVTHMISIGEETGQLDHMLEKVADFYEDDVEQMATRISAIIEPLMIVGLALIVGTIVLAAMLPMFSIYENIK